MRVWDGRNVELLGLLLWIASYGLSLQLYFFIKKENLPLLVVGHINCKDILDLLDLF